MKKISKINFEKLCIFILFLGIICSFKTAFATDSVKIEKVSNSSSGRIIKVSSNREMVSVKLFLKDNAGNYAQFYIDDSINAKSKNYFISKWRISLDENYTIKVIARFDDGTEISSETNLEKVPKSEQSKPSSDSNNNENKNNNNGKNNNNNSNSSGNKNNNNNSNNNSKTEVKSVSLNKSKLTLYKNGKNSEKLIATINPSKNTSGKWSTSNKKVATVDSNGNVKAVANGTATITFTAGGKSAKCQVTVKTAQTEQAGQTGKTFSKTLNSSNCKKVATVLPKVSSCYIGQSFCVTDKYYICALAQKSSNNSKSKAMIQVYDKSGNYKNKASINSYHSNGMTYNPNTKMIHVATMKDGKLIAFSSNNIQSVKSLSTTTVKLNQSSSGIAYDTFKNEYYTKAGKTLRRYDSSLKKLSSFSMKSSQYHQGQDVGSYNGLMLVIDTKSYGSNYIYIYNAKTGAYLGNYHVTLSGAELESVAYDPYKKNFALMCYYPGGTTKIYTTTAISLDKYCN